MSDHTLDLSERSAVEPGPWHYGADYVTVYFKGERSKLEKLVPAPFMLADGTCMAYVCEIVSVSDERPQLASEYPERTLYREAAVGVKCTHRDSPGIYFPVMWVDTEWSLLRGLSNGYSKRLADRIVMTRLHPLNPAQKPVSGGTVFTGFCVKGDQRTLRVKVTVERQGGVSDLVSFGKTYGIRKYPATDSSQSRVAEAVDIPKSNSRSSDIWVGSGVVETTLDVGSTEVTRGAVYRSGFTIGGSKVLARL
ncbi:MAG TPA: acetoacetate decarboxylase family protein [Nitrososphaerales archaeon]|nr:acetoacetate decarboxylase family protein [Nitrososphaerales archaeon]HUK74436.1 acetoacetate decarboxylase family protein [Nitrososphaerales archaeon]